VRLLQGATAVGSRKLALRHQLNVLQQRAPHSMPGRNGILAAREAKRADDTML